MEELLELAGGPLHGAAIVLLLAGVYMLPWLVAWIRGHHQTLAIFALNLLLGTTGLGWVLALVWALTAVRREPAAAPKPVSERMEPRIGPPADQQ